MKLQAYEWSDGRAIVATGSPFAPVSLPDGRTFIPSQCNNMYIFPGVGLAASVAGVQQITDGMLYAAAVACVDAMTPEEVADGRTFPDISRIRQVDPHGPFREPSWSPSRPPAHTAGEPRGRVQRH